MNDDTAPADFLRQCDRLCRAAIGRTVAGWTVVRLGVAPISGTRNVVVDCYVASAARDGIFMSVKQRIASAQIGDLLSDPEALVTRLIPSRTHDW